jgi:hypothetical protein
MASKNSEQSPDCDTAMKKIEIAGLSVESLLVFLQKIVAENPAAAGMSVFRGEGWGAIEKTTVVEIHKGRLVLT